MLFDFPRRYRPCYPGCAICVSALDLVYLDDKGVIAHILPAVPALPQHGPVSILIVRTERCASCWNCPPAKLWSRLA